MLSSGVGDGVGVGVGVAVGVGVLLGVGVGVPVGVGEELGCGVGDSVGVVLGVGKGEEEGEGVTVSVGVGVLVAIGVLVGDGVFEGEGVGVGVSEGVRSFLQFSVNVLLRDLYFDARLTRVAAARLESDRILLMIEVNASQVFILGRAVFFSRPAVAAPLFGAPRRHATEEAPIFPTSKKLELFLEETVTIPD